MRYSVVSKIDGEWVIQLPTTNRAAAESLASLLIVKGHPTIVKDVKTGEVVSEGGTDE